MKIQIAEDENQKLDHIRDFAESLFKNSKIVVSKSVRSAFEILEDYRPQILFLDMSLPTFEIGSGEPGGRPQGFGGIEVMRYADSLDLDVAIFVITAYEGFEEGHKAVDLTELKQKLETEHGARFKGIVYYGGLGGEWSEMLKSLIVNAGFLGDFLEDSNS